MQTETQEYIARQGAPFKDGEAQVIGEYISKFKTPAEILDDTKTNSASPIKEYLNWDDTLAAEEYRLQQIKNIVNHIEVRIVYSGGESKTFDRAFEYVSDSEGRQYIPIQTALSNEEYKRQVLQRAWATLQGWVNRYQEYKEFKPVVEAYKKVEESLFVSQ